MEATLIYKTSDSIETFVNDYLHNYKGTTLEINRKVPNKPKVKTDYYFTYHKIKCSKPEFWYVIGKQQEKDLTILS